jgi:hypothetical protein
MHLSILHARTMDIRATDWSGSEYTLCGQFDYECHLQCHLPNEDRQSASAYNQEFLRVAMGSYYWWRSDTYLVERLRGFLERHVLAFRWKTAFENAAEVVNCLYDAVRDGHIIALPGDMSALRRSSSGASAPESPRPRSATVTPSSLYRRTSLGAQSWSAFDSTANMDRIPLGAAQPFRYIPEVVNADAEELAASTRSPDYAAKMLGYDRDIFGDMVHAMKDANRLRGDDNVIWHDNGDVYFKGRWLDNMYNY